MAEAGLAETLDAMNAALRQGDLAALGGLSVAVEAALDRGLPATRAEADHLRRAAAENAVLLDAVGRGLRAARTRLEEIAQARAGLRTYGPAGQARAWADHSTGGRRF